MAGKKKSGGQVDFKVTASGLNKVEKDAKKAGSGFNTLDKNARSADRGMKGASQMSSNATKNFSKMSQGISGGLVPAYATLAAQLFALDALFRFLKDAADFRVLAQGQEAFAATTGRAMKTIAREIQAATAAQITFKEASQAAAIGLAAGLSPQQMKELGEAAKVISVALGRDVTDSFNRLVRGVTKAEPELLDELGIILRLEEASVRYASALGLNKNQLTTFQKSQAVANEVLRQSEERYGAIAEMLGDDSVNQLNKLSVAFDEVLNRFRNFIGPIAEFFGTFLVNNIESATAAMGIFAASITGGLLRQAIPTIDTRGAASQVQENLGNLLLEGDTDASKARKARMLAGTADEKDLAIYQRSLKAKESSLLSFEKVSRAEATRTFNLLKLQRQQMVVESSVGFARMRAKFVMELYTMQAEHGKVMGAIKMGFVSLGRVASGIMRFAGFIGMAVMIFQMAKQLINQFRKVDKTIEELENKTESLTRAQEQLNDELRKTRDVFQKGLFKTASQEIEAIGNAFQSADLTNRIHDYNAMKIALGANNEKVQEFGSELRDTLLILGEYNPRFKEFAEMVEHQPDQLNKSAGELNQLSQEYILQGQAIKAVAEATANASKQLNNYIQSLPKVAYQDVIISMEQMRLGYEQIIAGQEKHGNDATEFKNKLAQVTGQMDAYSVISKAAFENTSMLNEVQLQMAKGKHAIFGDKGQLDRLKAVSTDMRKMFDAQIAVFQAESNLRDAERNGGEALLEIRKQQLLTAKQMEDIALNTLASSVAMENVAFRVNKMIMEGLTDELGNALGKVLRGETGAFENFGDALAKKLTDAIGDKIAENIMKITYGGTPLDPTYQQELFKQSLKDSFKEGFEDKDSPLQKGGVSVAGTIYSAMIDAGNAHVKGLYDAQIGLQEARVAEAKGRQTTQQNIVTGYKNTIERYKTGGVLEKEQAENKSDIEKLQAQMEAEYNRVLSARMEFHAQGGGGENAFIRFLHKYTTPNGIAALLGGSTEADKKYAENFLKEDKEYQVLEKNLKQLQNTSTDLSDEVADGARKLSIANAELDGAERSLKEFDKGVVSAQEALDKMQANPPKYTSNVYDPNMQDPGKTQNENSNPTSTTPSVGTIDPDYFGKKAEELFPELFKVFDDGSGDMSFGQNVLKFGTAITQFATLTAQGMALAGKQEEAADIMLEVAKIQMALAMAEMAIQLKSLFPARYGGIMSHSGKSFSAGGISDGPQSGYNATLHGTEAVIPLGNDRAIPVKMQGAMGSNNVNVTVNVDQNGQASTLLTGDGAAQLGRTIAAIAQDTIAKEQRAGGLLSSI